MFQERLQSGFGDFPLLQKPDKKSGAKPLKPSANDGQPFVLNPKP